MSESSWNTIDSDAGVFTELCEKLQINDIQFEDLYSMDEDSLRALAPLYGVIFLFKYGSVDRTDQPLDGQYDFDSDIFFANQTIQNACATQAVLNVLLNKTEVVDIGPELGNFKGFVNDFDSVLKGETISNSELIRTIHNSFSAPNPFIDEDDDSNPDRDEKDDGLFHFIGYLRYNNYIYELDGLKAAPIRHVSCNNDEEFIEKLPEILTKRVSHYLNESRFSLLAITNNKLEQAQRIGDEHSIQQELRKRSTWQQENDLRRTDLIGLVHEFNKSIAAKSTDQEWNTLLNEGKKKSQAKLLKQLQRR